jgi:hypothetical protein
MTHRLPADDPEFLLSKQEMLEIQMSLHKARMLVGTLQRENLDLFMENVAMRRILRELVAACDLEDEDRKRHAIVQYLEYYWAASEMPSDEGEDS